MQRPHDLVMFDLDGTISDPLVGISRSINFALTQFGHQPMAVPALAKYVGPPIDETFKAITGIPSEAGIHELVAKYRERYAEIGYAENVLYAGVPEALARIHEVGMPLGLCTSKRADFAERILEMFGLRHYFRFVSGGDIGVQKWQQIADLKSRGLVTGAAVMVGDRAIDIIAAHKNGLSACGVLWGHGSQAELARENPCYLFASPDKLPCLAEGGRVPSV